VLSVGRFLVAIIAALVFAQAVEASGPRVVVRPVPETHLRIGVPSGWKMIDRAEAVVLVQRIATLSPQIASLVETVATHGTLIKLVTYDPRLASGFATNANVVAQPSPASSLSAAVALELPLVRRVLHPVGLTKKAIRVAGRPAYEISFNALFNGPSGGNVVAETQIYVVDGGTLYVLTLTTLPGLRASYAGTFAAIVQSLSFD
jgi:hypothetical protein